MLSAWSSSWRMILSNKRGFSTAPGVPIIYMDTKMFVVNKPAGYHSQIKGGQPDVLDLIKGCASYKTGDVWVCHRLDKLTTGALICTKTARAARDLNQQFKQRIIEKVYLALVVNTQRMDKAGTTSQPLTTNDGIVSLWEDSSPTPKLDAVTEYEVLGTSPIAPVSLLRFAPKTGRKHQLRVHSAYNLKAPILGDVRYMERTMVSVPKGLQLPPETLYLHSASISCYRYLRGQPRFKLGIMAPLPHPFVKICKSLQISVPEECVQGGLYVDGQQVFPKDSRIEGIGGGWLL